MESTAGTPQLVPTVSEQVARWSLDMDLADIPSDVVDIAKLLVIDQLGLQVKGSTLPHVQPELRLVREMGARAEASVTNTDLRTTAAQAAYVNGTFGHSMEFDDCHLTAWHAGSVVVPAAFAMAERGARSGAEVLAAIVAGYQVVATVGSVTTPEMMARGWHGPKTMGGFGAAAVAARLTDASPETLSNAFGIAASDASGIMEYDQSGGEVKRQHAGSAARAGIDALLMASYGLTGPRTAFEGKRGIFAIFGAGADHSGLEQEWATWQLRGNMFRLNPGVGTILAALDVVAALQQEHALDWRELEAVRIGLRPFGVGHGGEIARPQDGIMAHFSLAFAVALRLTTGASAPEDYVNPAMWDDPSIHEASALVKPYTHEFGDDVPLLCARVEIETKDGRVLSGFQPSFRGSQFLPAKPEEVLGKFRANVRGQLTDKETDGLVDAVMRLESVDDISEITVLTAAAQP